VVVGRALVGGAVVAVGHAAGPGAGVDVPLTGRVE
jgi:hypothetical protein